MSSHEFVRPDFTELRRRSRQMIDRSRPTSSAISRSVRPCLTATAICARSSNDNILRATAATLRCYDAMTPLSIVERIVQAVSDASDRPHFGYAGEKWGALPIALPFWGR